MTDFGYKQAQLALLLGDIGGGETTLDTGWRMYPEQTLEVYSGGIEGVYAWLYRRIGSIEFLGIGIKITTLDLSGIPGGTWPIEEVPIDIHPNINYNLLYTETPPIGLFPSSKSDGWPTPTKYTPYVHYGIMAIVQNNIGNAGTLVVNGVKAGENGLQTDEWITGRGTAQPTDEPWPDPIPGAAYPPEENS